MPSRDFTRSDRISAELRRLLGSLVHEAVRDHALPSVSVSDVEVTRDFDMATVYVTALLADTAAEAVKSLNEMAKEFRRELSKDDAHASRARTALQVRRFGRSRRTHRCVVAWRHGFGNR